MLITSKRAIQKTAEATGDSTGNKIADKITSVSTEFRPKESTKYLPNDETLQKELLLRKDIYPQKKYNELLTN